MEAAAQPCSQRPRLFLSVLSALTSWFDSFWLKLSAVAPAMAPMLTAGKRGKQLLAVSVSFIKDAKVFPELHPCPFTSDWLELELAATMGRLRNWGMGLLCLASPNHRSGGCVSKGERTWILVDGRLCLPHGVWLEDTCW